MWAPYGESGMKLLRQCIAERLTSVAFKRQDGTILELEKSKEKTPSTNYSGLVTTKAHVA
jgi:hypothetical protein